MDSFEVAANFREIAVLLRRGNIATAGPVLEQVAAHLRTSMQTAAGSSDADSKRAEQATFAIEEIRVLLSEGNFRGAAAAAAEAAKEWTVAERSVTPKDRGTRA